MSTSGPHLRRAFALAVALHLVAAWLLVPAFNRTPPERTPPREPAIVSMVVIHAANPPPEQVAPPAPRLQPPTRPSARPTARPAPPPAAAPAPATDRPQATMDAPPAPSAEEWALAASYTLKNSKRYRHNWSQQVRSLMGTAHEGPDQGAVRFRIQIAPSGRLDRLDTLWATSDAVEQRARKAVQQMPPLPPTPNGKPLIFEKTITFDAFTAEAPPLYKNDCEPDPVQHRNRFVWDGRSPQGVAEQAVAEKLDPAAYAECLKLLPKDSIEAEAASDERQQKQWASPTLSR